MVLQVLKDDVFGDSAVGGREISTPPEAPAPIAAPQLREFTLNLVRGPPLHPSYQITDRQFRRHRHEHVDVVARQHAPDNVDTLLFADFPADVTHAQPNVARQHLVAILRAKAVRLEVGGFAPEEWILNAY